MATQEQLEIQLKETQQALDIERQRGLVAMIQSLENTTNLKLDKMHNEVKSLIESMSIKNENMHIENSLLLKQTYDQTLKTNGRVTKIEETIIPELRQEIDDIKNKCTACPVSNTDIIKDYNDIKDDLRFVKWIKKHPWVASAIIVVFILIIKFVPNEWVLNFLNFK